MHSLKTKLVAAISVLIILLFSLSTLLFLNEKTNELTHDIFSNARSFAQLTATDIVSNYQLFIPQKSFIYFNREVQGIFDKFPDLASIQIVNYKGEIVYDSLQEQQKQYEGAARIVSDKVLLSQVKSRNQSVKTLDTVRVVYLKNSDENAAGYLTIDENEKPVKPLATDEKVKYVIQPANDSYAVVYYLSYANLQERINQTIYRGLLLSIFGVGLGIFFAYFFASSMTKPLKALTTGAGIIATGDFKHRVVVKTKDEIASLANAFNSMAAELEVSTKALVYKERVAKELELAAKIQKDLLPKDIPKINGMDISAGLLPAEEIGGDCYDFIKLNEDNLVMYLGDVTGHGVPSGIVVAIANALIFNYAGKAPLKEMLLEVNRVMKEKTASNMFITLVLLQWDAIENKLKYVSAGHEQMVHYHAKDGSVTLTPAGGLALGMLPNIEHVLNENELIMDAGDTLVIYSDGIPEAWKSADEMYGMENLKKAVVQYAKLESATDIRNSILADVKNYTGQWKQMDDMTMMVLKKR